VVAKAAKAAGIEAQVDTRLEGDREALLEQLRHEREHAHHAGDAILSDVDALFGKRD